MQTTPLIDSNYKYGFHKRENYVFKSKKGLDSGVVQNISWHKNEPEWMRQFRLRSLEIFYKKQLPIWGGDLSTINFDNIYYYIKPIQNKVDSWSKLPKEIKDTYDKIGIPEAEKKFLSGVSAQYECLTGDALIFGKAGAIRLKDIIPGTTVYALNEKTRTLVKQKVLGVSNKGKRPIFLIRVAGRTLRCTVNHPFLRLHYDKKPGKQRGNFSTTWEYFNNLRVGDYIAIAKTLPDEGMPYTLPFVSLEKNYIGRNKYGTFTVSAEWLYNRRQKMLSIPKRSTESFLWLIGLYLGDGYITRVRKNLETEVLSIAIPATESTIRKKVKEVLSEVFKYELGDEKDVYRIRIPAFPIIQLLKKLGLTGTAKTKMLPDWVFSLPRSQKLACIGGYIDSDGYLRNDKKNSDVWITSVNKALLEPTEMLALSCGLHVGGIYSFIYTPDVTNSSRKSTGYRLLISGDLSPLIPYSLKVSQGFIPRRYYHRYGSHHKSPITSHVSDHIGFAAIQEIVAAGEEEVYDIEVNGNHNFIANGIVVHNSEVVYKSVNEMLTRKGVVFLDMDSGLREFPDLVRQYFGTIIPPMDNKFAALNSAVWSGGSFVYVPKGVKVELPLQAYFRINAANMGQFERTLIIADEGSFVHYVEGCLPVGEQVSLGDCWANIESIKPKDLVVGADGHKHRVRASMTREYHGEMMTISPVSPYNTFQLTPEHPVLVIKRSTVGGRKRFGWLSEVSTSKLLQKKPVYLPASQLERGDFLVFPKVHSTPQEVFTDDELKLLGYYLAEGSTYMHKTLKQAVVSFSISEKETDFADELKRLIRLITGKNPMYIHDQKKHGLEIRVYSKMLRDYVLGHCGKGAATKVLSPELMSVSVDKIMILLTAYWRGDGNILQRKGSTLMRACTFSETLARQLQELFARVGIYCSIHVRLGGKDEIKGRQMTRRDQYILVYTPNKLWTTVRDAGNYFLVPINAIKKRKYNGPVFNLDVADIDSYLVRGFAVHNCTAPVYTTDSLHSAVVEIIVKKGARVRYTTIQNWSTNVYNLVTKRARVEEEGVMEWVDGNLGSKLTMKYPSIYLMGRKARGEVLSIAYAGPHQHQDAGGKAIHIAPETTSQIISKSVSRGGGRTSYRGLVQINPGATKAKSKVVCDALLLDEHSRSDTYPTMKIDEQDVQVEHEATVSKIGDEQLFYLQSRGISKGQGESMIVNGFIEPIVKELPLEYAVEMNRLIQLQMEGSVG